MNQLLSQIAANGTGNSQNNVSNQTQPVFNLAQQAATPGPTPATDRAASLVTAQQPADYTNHSTNSGGQSTPGAGMLNPPPPFLQPTTYQATDTAQPHSGEPAMSRGRHHTSGQPYATPLGWLGHSTLPPRSPLLAGQQRVDYLAAQQQPAHPWDHPATLQDLGSNPLTRRVVEAIHTAAAPFSGHMGKHAQFPHHLITRGPKKQKTNLGELGLAEYVWGLLQIIKARDPSDDSVPYMNLHLERVVEDATIYAWEGVRQWSEDVCSRVSLGTLRWSDTYIIDRLQSQTSHGALISKDSKQLMQGRVDSYDMSEEVKKAKPGLPCKFHQMGTCSYSSDHVQNGYRQLHVCAYCLANKCQLQPHTGKECKTKKFNSQKKNQSESGFGN